MQAQYTVWASQSDSVYFGDYETPFQLPGHGEPYDTCSDYRHYGCLNTKSHDVLTRNPKNQANLKGNLVGAEYTNKVAIKRVRYSCKRSTCPLCYEDWAAKEAGKIEYRMKEAEKKLTILQTAKHVVVSLPKYDYDAFSDDHQRMKKRAITYAKKVGVHSGVIIPHPWRRKCPRCGSAMEDGNRRFKLCGTCGHVGFKWYYSPHFHIIGYGYVRNDKIAKLHKRTTKNGVKGYVIVDLGARESIFSTAWYQLSHCGIHPERKTMTRTSRPHSVTWFGNLSYNKMKVPKMPKNELLCPICFSEMLPVKWDSDTLPNPLSEEEKGMFFVPPDKWRYKSKKIRNIRSP